MKSVQNWFTVSTAVERVEYNLQADSKFKSLGDLLRANPHQPSLSGLQDIDYPNMLNPLHRTPLVSHIKTVPLPTEVIEQFINMKQDCNLGVFPEISRAWLSVDSSLFFWTYDNAGDVAYYDGLEHSILAVHLFKPKPNVFKSHIKYLLCLVTALEITLLGVTCSESEGSDLSTVLLIPDPVYKLPTDNVILSVLAGTDDGRMFFGGNDGCLYEIAYQAEEGWLTRKCRKINHSYSIISYVTPYFLNFSESEPIVQIEIDNSRHLLYARTERSTIQLYDLGHDGQSLRQVSSKSLSAIVNQASCVARTIDTSNFKPIIGIKALTRNESDSVNLVAVTKAGVRLYFSTCGGDRPSSFDLVHVRLPPAFTPTSAMPRPNAVSNIYHKDNTFIMTSFQTDNKDFLWVLSNDFYVYEDQMMESFSVNSLGGRVWCIAEEKRSNFEQAGYEVQNPPLVVRQQFEDMRKFILLTSEGIHIFHKQRPIDQLAMLLLENRGPDAPAVRSFFQSTKLSESCLTSLILASSSNLPSEDQLSGWATLAFFNYGGEPRLIKQTNHNGTYMVSMSTPIGSPVHSATGINVSPIAVNHHDNATICTDQADIQYSARHDAIYLYLARILRPIWLLKAASTETNQDNHKILISTATIDEITLYLRRLYELKKFLDSNVQIIGDQTNTSKVNMRNEASDAVRMERESLSNLVRLLVRCIEVLNLYKLLHEHHFSIICAILPADTQMKMSIMTFKDLIVMGTDMTTHIASALVRRYLDDNISTDTICRRLHELCPSIFRQENALQAKAHEMILQSRAIIDKVDKERMMNEAVSLLKKIGIRLDLQAVCDLLHSARAYRYIVDVCLFVAEKRDPLKVATLHQSRMMNSTLDDGEERARANAKQARMDCYVKIIDTLDRLLNSDDFNDVFDFCTKSTDELFHTELYNWLCEKNISSKLLEIQSPFVESFLKRKAEETFSANYLNLMWRFYERRGNFLGAARILDKLASEPGTDYGLDERLEYLCRSKSCLEALTMPGEYLHELEEKMEVIQIQIQIYTKLKKLPESAPVQEAMSQLNYSLKDLTQLYQNYAQKFNLYDSQLAILKCGNHYEPALIEKLWKCIIDEVLRSNSQESTDDQLHDLSDRIVTLGKMLMPSERFFPAYYIIAYLEFKTHPYNNLRWVPKCLMKIGFKPLNLIDPYHKFYKSREHSVYWPEKSIHVLRVIACLIEDSLPNSDRSFANACLDVICDYLIDLQTMVTSDSAVKKLQETFTILQSRINQLLS